MAKQVKKVDTASAPIKSRKPKYPGTNSPVDFPKAFRSHGNDILMKAVMSSKKKVKHHD